MKLVAASDLHGVVDISILPDADVCVLAGDIAPLHSLHSKGKRKQAKWVREEFCEFMRSRPSCEFVFVAGNHDFWGEAISPDDEMWPDNAHYLRNTGCEVLGLKFFGMPQVPPINGVWAFESRPEVMRDACAAIPEGIDILVTHTPPKVAGSDIDSSKGTLLINGKSPHFGSEELTDAIERVQPRYAFCGHIHTGDHSCLEIGGTNCFNVSIVDEDYRLGFSSFEEEI